MEYYIYNVVKIENPGIKDLFLENDCKGILLTSSMEAKIFHEVLGSAEINKNIYAIGRVSGTFFIDMHRVFTGLNFSSGLVVII